MTFIAFHATEKSAHLMTDSINYTTHCEVLGQSTKRTPLDHLDAVLATQGNTLWGNTVAASLMQLSSNVATFTELVEHAPQIARGCRDNLEEQHPGAEVGEGFVVLLGWSRTLDRFVGYVLHSRNDYEARLHEGTFVYPMPWSFQPTQEQIDGLIEWGDGGEDVRSAADIWQTKPTIPTPATDDEWINVAELVRMERAESLFAHVLVAGNVYLSKIKRGFQSTRKVHQFNDQGQGLAAALIGTRHPIALAGPCPCGSGERSADCHERQETEQAAGTR